jgi:thiamine-phosphate diphosphorylase
MVTDRRRLTRLRSSGFGAASEEDALVRCVAAAAQAGVDLIQVRESDLEGGALTRLVARCVEAARSTETRVLVNDRFDVALAAGAHGVHLPGHGFSAPRVRAVAPGGFLIGRSVHHASEAARVAEEGGLDYIVFGTVFPTASKAGVAPAGVKGLAAAVAAVTLPVLAIGGVTLQRAPEIARAGAAGVAAIGMFADSCTHGIDPLKALVAEWTRQW